MNLGQLIKLEPEIRWIITSRMAQALNYPDKDLVAGLLDHAFFQDIMKVFEALERPDAKKTLESLQKEYDQAKESPEELLLTLEKDYTWMCFASKPREVYLFESVYREGKLLQESTFEIARLYYEAGLQMDEGFDMPPDHIAIEFEFMAYLCFNEIKSINEGNEKKIKYSQRLQKQGIEEHLGPFASKIAVALEKNAKTSFYRATGKMLSVIFSDFSLPLEAQ